MAPNARPVNFGSFSGIPMKLQTEIESQTSESRREPPKGPENSVPGAALGVSGGARVSGAAVTDRPGEPSSSAGGVGNAGAS